MNCTTKTRNCQGAFEAVPDEIKNLGKRFVYATPSDKTPRQPNGEPAKVNDPNTWSDWETICRAASAAGGFPGVMLTADDPLCCLDLDGALDARGEVIQEFADYVHTLGQKTYCEVSVGGDGLHYYFSAKEARNAKRMFPGPHKAAELYCRGRFIILTGRTWGGCPSQVSNLQDEYDSISGTLSPVGSPPSGSGAVPDLTGDGVDEATYAELQSVVKSYPESVGGQGGHAALLHAACNIARLSIRYPDLSEVQGRELFECYNEHCAYPPEDERQINHKWRDAKRMVLLITDFDSIETSDGNVQQDVILASLALTDLGNAERFAIEYSSKVRYLPLWAQWFAWDGARWKADEKNQILTLAGRTVRNIGRQANVARDVDRAKALLRHALKSESRASQHALLELAKARPELTITPDELDNKPYLLNCANGTVDLRTGRLLEFDRDNLLTLSTGVAFPTTDSEAACQRWMQFLRETFNNDQELVNFVKRLVGCAIWGEQREHVFPICFGNGANGKSVFTTMLLEAFGDYGCQAPLGFGTAKNYASHPTELARLWRKRLVVSSENQAGAKLDEGFVKATTGGDRITARRMREDFWEFNPTHMMLTTTNHLPQIEGTDEGIWRRILEIPFTRTVPPEQRDAALPEKLRSELPGILKWCVDGCVEWQTFGLAPPDSVRHATRDYRLASDPFASWYRDCCRPNPDAKLRAADAYANFSFYCAEEGQSCISMTVFGRRLKELHERVRNGNGMVYCGVELQVDVVDQDASRLTEELLA